MQTGSNANADDERAIRLSDTSFFSDAHRVRAYIHQYAQTASQSQRTVSHPFRRHGTDLRHRCCIIADHAWWPCARDPGHRATALALVHGSVIEAAWAGVHVAIERIMTTPRSTSPASKRKLPTGIAEASPCAVFPLVDSAATLY
jgi:hypothetical protein